MKQQGQTLIEVVISLATVVVIITSITFAVTSSLNNADFTKNQTFASNFAQQGIEIIRAMRNNSYNNFNSLSGSYCLADNCNSITNVSGDVCGPKGGIAGCGQNTGNIFVRQVDLEVLSSTCNNVATKATVTVSWTDGKCASQVFCHNVKAITCLSDFGVIPTP